MQPYSNLLRQNEQVSTLLMFPEEPTVGFLFWLIAWCFLFALAWPIAVLLLVLLPFIWLISLPFQIAAIAVGATFALIRAILFLPARLLGSRG